MRRGSQQRARPLRERTLQETTLPETTLPETTLPETTLREATLQGTTRPGTTRPGTTIARSVGRLGPWLLALTVWGAAAAAQAVEPYLFSVGVLGGLGGPVDAGEPDPGIDQEALQLQVGLLTEPRTLVVLRVGRLEMDDDAVLDGLGGPSLEYATIAGEYRFFQEWYDSGIFLGLGGYRLQGDRGGFEDEDTSIGLTLGVTGDVEMTERFSIIAELTGHWADLEATQLFAAGQVGLAVKF